MLLTCGTNPDLQQIRFDYLLLFLKELVRIAGFFIPVWEIFIHARTHTHTNNTISLYGFYT
jgi:hypothetical protein